MARNAAAPSMIAALVLGIAVAASAEPDYLTADEVRALMVGKTIEVLDPSGAKFRVYFDPDGRRLAVQGSGEYALPWRILPDGNQCVNTSTGEDCARIARNVDGTYTRYREGKEVNRWLSVLPGKALVAAVPPPGIYARKTGPDKYEIMVTGPKLDEQLARQQVTAAAGSLCKELVPELGAYKFESTEAVTGAGAGAGPAAMQYLQQVSCVAGARTAPAERRPTLQSAEEALQVRRKIQVMSEAYFRMVVDGRIDEAYAQVDGSALGLSAAAWKSSKQSFGALAGEPVKLAIVKVTVYDNPADAREPGLYVAADYSNEYRNVPVHCGYLMWFRPMGGEFRIIREETGHITAEQMKSIPAAQLPAIKKGLRCVEPG